MQVGRDKEMLQAELYRQLVNFLLWQMSINMQINNLIQLYISLI